MEGRIEHLVLLATCGMRFEGPKFDNLKEHAEPADSIPRSPNAADGEQPDSASRGHSRNGDEDGSDSLTIYPFPHEWSK